MPACLDERTAEDDRGGSVKAFMRGAGGFREAQGAEGGVVFGQLDTGLQFKRGEVEGAGAGGLAGRRYSGAMSAPTATIAMVDTPARSRRAPRRSNTRP